MSLGGARRGFGHGGMGLESMRGGRKGREGDVEAGDFDESELDELHIQTPTDLGGEPYSIGSEDEEEEEKRLGNGHANGKGKSGAGGS